MNSSLRALFAELAGDYNGGIRTEKTKVVSVGNGLIRLANGRAVPVRKEIELSPGELVLFIKNPESPHGMVVKSWA